MIEIIEYGKSRKFKYVTLACLYLALKGHIGSARDLFEYSLYGEVEGKIEIERK